MAVLPEPATGGLEVWIHRLDFPPESLAMILVLEMRKLVYHDIIDDKKRGHDEPPREIEIPPSAAGAPAGESRGDPYFSIPQSLDPRLRGDDRKGGNDRGGRDDKRGRNGRNRRSVKDDTFRNDLPGRFAIPF